MMESKRYSTISDLAREFAIEYYDNIASHPSYRSVIRYFHKENYVRKVIERRHILQDPVKRLEFMERIAHVDPFDSINLDESASSPDQFLQKYGWAPKGEDCIRMQIVIGTRHFSVIAAYTVIGFLCWDIFEGLYSAKEFCHFLQHTL